MMCKTVQNRGGCHRKSRRLFRGCFSTPARGSSSRRLSELSARLSAVRPSAASRIDNYSDLRAGERPKKRLRQGVSCSRKSGDLPPDEWLSRAPIRGRGIHPLHRRIAASWRLTSSAVRRWRIPFGASPNDTSRPPAAHRA